MSFPLDLTIGLILVSVCLVIALIMAAMLRTPTTRTVISKVIGMAIAVAVCVLFVAVAVWSHPTTDRPLTAHRGVQTVFGQLAELRTENSKVKEELATERDSLDKANRFAEELSARVDSAEQQKQEAERQFAARLWELETDFGNKQDSLQKQLVQLNDAIKRDRIGESPYGPPFKSDGVAPSVDQSITGGWVACRTDDWQPCTRNAVTYYEPLTPQAIICCKPVMSPATCSPRTVVIFETAPIYLPY